MIDFEWYRSFISIYKHRSVSAAAKARILTQPAMSQHLSALESEVGEPLFIRAPRKMIPTLKGKELYTKIVPLIENLESATLEIRHASSKTSLAPIVRFGSPAEYFTKAVIPQLKDIDIRFIVQFSTAGLLLEKLEKDELDFTITTQKLNTSSIEYVKIVEEEFVVVTPASYSSSAVEISDIEVWLMEQKWLSYGVELPIVRRYWREHFGKRPEVPPIHIVPDLRTILEAIENGMGVSILPTYLLKDSLEAKRSKVMFPHLSVNNTIYAAYKIEHRSNPVIEGIVKKLKGEE
ncbi:LysR family transcriptional regulator [Rossellomorea sp. GCM10028870]|uniref:LysR family transcriptional regulator n=1 Tax=Rossellomorea sp. GCM10028870 TaxID=3273426 RepID=UPI0026191427|nr:LysR family transcriptional regulator [uncultured Rossellomorea sp.]